MASWIASGHLAEAILALIIMEWLGLASYHLATGKGPDPVRLGPTLLAGFCLVVALRAAILGSDSLWLPAALAAALCAHVIDIMLRWSR